MEKKLIDITPSKFKCGDMDALCPAIFKSNEKTYVIIGKTVNVATYADLHNRVGSDETAIEISLELIEEALK